VNTHYPAADADHALVVVVGTTPSAGALDRFCTHHATRGVDVWLVDPPGEDNPEAWTAAAIAAGEHVRHSTGLPVFVHGSTAGVVAAFAATQMSMVFNGGVLLVDAAVAGHNVTPILYVAAESDLAAARVGYAVAAASSHLLELEVYPTISTTSY
jgi:hypothetical protein